VLDLPTPPEVVNLVRQTDAMRAMTHVRNRLAVSTKEMCDRAGITTNSVHAWTRGGRSPILSRFLKLAASHGYDVVLLAANGETTDFRDLTACICRIDRERRAKGVGLHDMELRAGVSFRSFYAWRNKQRSPNLANIVALAETFGFSVIMRRTTPA